MIITALSWASDYVTAGKLLAVGLALLVISVGFRLVMPIVRRCSAIRTIHRLGCTVAMQPGGPEWLRTLCGDRLMTPFDEVRDIFFSGVVDGDTALASLAVMAPGLPRLRELFLSDLCLSDESLAHLETLQRHSDLHGVNLSGTPVTDEGLRRLSALGRLEVLSLVGTQITDDGLMHLQNLCGLQRLSLCKTSITDRGLAHLAALSQLRMLYLDEVAITDAGLFYLSCIRTLELLSLKSTDIGMDGLRHMSQLPRLRWLYVTGSRVTSQELLDFKQNQPHVTVLN